MKAHAFFALPSMLGASMLEKKDSRRLSQLRKLVKWRRCSKRPRGFSLYKTDYRSYYCLIDISYGTSQWRYELLRFTTDNTTGRQRRGSVVRRIKNSIDNHVRKRVIPVLQQIFSRNAIITTVVQFPKATVQDIKNVRTKSSASPGWKSSSSSTCKKAAEVHPECQRLTK
jgi:hypothetical protein